MQIKQRHAASRRTIAIFLAAPRPGVPRRRPSSLVPHALHGWNDAMRCVPSWLTNFRYRSGLFAAHQFFCTAVRHLLLLPGSRQRQVPCKGIATHRGQCLIQRTCARNAAVPTRKCQKCCTRLRYVVLGGADRVAGSPARHAHSLQRPLPNQKSSRRSLRTSFPVLQYLDSDSLAKTKGRLDRHSFHAWVPGRPARRSRRRGKEVHMTAKRGANTHRRIGSE